MQEKGAQSVPLVVWTDREGAPGPLSPPSLSHRPFPTLATHLNLSVFLLWGHLLPPAGLGTCVKGRASPAPGPLLAQALVDPRAGLSVSPCVRQGWGLAGAGHWQGVKDQLKKQTCSPLEQRAGFSEG